MSSIGKGFIGAAVMTLALGGTALAQYQYQPSYQDDMTCRQWADQQVAPLRAQAGSAAVGSTLGGAALGAALGAAIGGGRGAGIGAASGAVLGAGTSAANSDAYVAQQYNAYYSQCMASRTAPQRPPAGYAPPQPTASQLNQQQYYQQSPPPAGYYPGYAPGYYPPR